MQPWLDLWIFDAVNSISKGHAGIPGSGSLPRPLICCAQPLPVAAPRGDVNFAVCFGAMLGNWALW